jgi:hypothetical protein
MDNFVADLISQKSKTASYILSSKSKIKLEKKLSRKHLNLSRSHSINSGRNQETLLSKVIEEQKKRHMQKKISIKENLPKILFDNS